MLLEPSLWVGADYEYEYSCGSPGLQAAGQEGLQLRASWLGIFVLGTNIGTGPSSTCGYGDLFGRELIPYGTSMNPYNIL